MRDEKLHTQRKRTLANAFSRQNILKYERHIDAGMAKLRLQLDKHAESGELLNIRTWIKLFVFDVLGGLLFNQDFGALDSGDVTKLPRSEEHVRIALAAGLVPWTVKYTKLISRIPIQAIQKLYEGRRQVVAMANSCVKHLEKQTGEEDTLLACLLSARDPDTDELLDIEDVKSEALGFL